MVEDRTTDGVRIAQLLSSELDGREDPPLDSLVVVNANRDVEPSEDGTLAYEVEQNSGPNGKHVVSVFVHPDRIRMELTEGIESAEKTAREADLLVRPKAVEPPRVLIFVEQGAHVKRAVDALIAGLDAN
ncbi:hypothetical protein SAMN05421858_2131 [Haladaptatus litoreus]|uniref:DUF7993 domain-containing protein n=1 Tax=Haladaptatus litoreus TaxID=553468 RepID=A0A1N6ZQY9_9EURY|nr:hypothetical protein [Haladaptatus litoreus]SIR29259.1 hypothetical protein SAMN05421858_2131 [Haladaptatus litoreus]